LPDIWYGCETWSLKLREERKLRVFANGVLRRIFGPKRGKVTEEWRKLYNVELNDLYCSPDVFRVIQPRIIRRAGHVARRGNRKFAYRILVGGNEGKRTLGRLA